ncbi:MAG: ectoine/hydroxyectoine ABC transporter substrate-binding protein EhuB [Pseudomonadota bacterium]
MLYRWLFRALISVLVLGTLAFTLLSLRPPSESAWERIQRTGTIRIGHTAEAPYAFRDEDGRVTGEAPEVARKVLERLGITHIEWVQTDFGALLTQLRLGRVDMVAAGMFITPERERLVAFSRPSFCVQEALLVRQGNPAGLRSMSDFVGHGARRIAVLSGSVESDQAVLAGLRPEQIVSFPDAASAVDALRHDVVDGLALSDPTIRRLARTEPTLEAVSLATPATWLGCGGFAFRRQDRALSDAFDAELAKVIGSGEHLSLIEPLGFTRGNLPYPDHARHRGEHGHGG